MRVLRGAVVAGAVVAQTLATVGAAQAVPATSVLVTQGELVFTAAPGVVNQVTISVLGEAVQVTDTAVLSVGPGCVLINQHKVTCRTRPINSVRADLGDRSDRLQYYGPFSLTADGGDGDDTMTGGAGSDQLYGGVGEDKLYGGAGMDFLYGDSNVATPGCKSCSDELHGGPDGDELRGGELPDTLYGDGGADMFIETDGGSNTFNGGLGNDKIVGPGTNMRDTVDYTERLTAVEVNLAAGVGGEVQLGEVDTITGVQNIRGGKGADRLIGNGNSNYFLGTDSNDLCDPNGADGVQLGSC